MARSNSQSWIAECASLGLLALIMYVVDKFSSTWWVKSILLVLIVFFVGGLIYVGAREFYSKFTPWGRKKHEEIENKRSESCKRVWAAAADGLLTWLKWQHSDVIIVDAKVFMNAVVGNKMYDDSFQNLLPPIKWAEALWHSGTCMEQERSCAVCALFLKVVRQNELKIFMLRSWLKELSSSKVEGDEEMKRRIIDAQDLIEGLQGAGLLELLHDENRDQDCGCDEISKVVQDLKNKGKCPLVLTEDRDLRFRLNADQLLCASSRDMAIPLDDECKREIRALAYSAE